MRKGIDKGKITKITKYKYSRLLEIIYEGKI